MSTSGRFRRSDELLLVALASGASQNDAAASSGVSPRTVRRRRADAAFEQQLTAIRDGMVSQASGKLTAHATKAVDVLVALLSAPEPHIRLASARAFLELLVKVREHADLNSRLAALEQSVCSR